MNKIEEALVEIRKLRKIKEVFAVILYGSVARGDYSIRHSDIDILVILSEAKAQKKVDRIINKLNLKYRVRIHPEYQNKEIAQEGHTLLWKMLEEGQLLFSKGFWFMNQKDLGLNAFRLYRCDTSSLDKVNRVMMSRALHGRKGFKGVIDNVSIIDSGRGGLLVRKDKWKDIEMLFNRFKVKYKVEKTVYG